eukprot:Sspe_Gene.30096::Locus_14694_Transcript_1_1_Confidence_1.000_Length_1198::g.30096::m.30096
MEPRARHLLFIACLLLLTRGAEGRGGYGPYCNTDPTSPRRYTTDQWSQEPSCPPGTEQPLGDMVSYQVVNLSEPQYSSLFCCMANYTTIISSQHTVAELDDKARAYYEAADRVLARFDCRDFYPFFNCTPCQHAYRSWVCSVLFPRKCAGSNKAQKVCDDVCFEVVRKCPLELEFHCPTDDSYGSWGVPSSWDENTYGPFRGRCNPMQLNLNSAARPAGLGVALLLAVLLHFVL